MSVGNTSGDCSCSAAKSRPPAGAIGPLAKVPNLLAGHVAARPTGDNLLKALRTISLVTLDRAGIRHRASSDLTPLHRTLLQLLDVPEAAYARLAA